jgi:hypothetical protein
VLWGSLPNRVAALVVRWALLHRDELMENWRLLRNNQVPAKVAPLD